jgi:hypothetical protein
MSQRVLPLDVQARQPIAMVNAAAHRGERVRALVTAYRCSSLSESSRASRGLNVNEAGTLRDRILRVVSPRTHGGAGAKPLDWVNLWASALHLVSSGESVDGPAIEQRVSPS